MKPEEPLHQTILPAGQETEGRLWGLDLSRVKWVVLALVLGLLPGFATVELLGLAWASLIMFGPPFCVAAFQFFFLQDQPPGWLSDWVETRLTGGHLSPLRGRDP